MRSRSAYARMRARTDTNTLAYLNAQGIDGKATTKRHVVSTIMHTYTCFLFHVAPAVGASSNLGAPCQEVRCYTPHLYGSAWCQKSMRMKNPGEERVIFQGACALDEKCVCMNKSTYTHTHMHVCVCVCACVYAHIYIPMYLK